MNVLNTSQAEIPYLFEFQVKLFRMFAVKSRERNIVTLIFPLPTLIVQGTA